jgi:hypothetical protein
LLGSNLFQVIFKACAVIAILMNAYTNDKLLVPSCYYIVSRKNFYCAFHHHRAGDNVCPIEPAALAIGIFSRKIRYITGLMFRE